MGEGEGGRIGEEGGEGCLISFINDFFFYYQFFPPGTKQFQENMIRYEYILELVIHYINAK